MSRLCIELPDDISDETAFQLEGIFLELAEAVGSRYLGEIMRHLESIRNERPCFQEDLCQEDPPDCSDPLNPF